MVSRKSEQLYTEVSAARLQLKKYEPSPWFTTDHVVYTAPTSPSEWFSKMFPDCANQFGTPFIEEVEPVEDGVNQIRPLALNVDFFAGTLAGDPKLGHKVVYIESECAFYYFDPRDHLYKQVSEDKLGNLLRGYFMRCAEQLPNNVHKLGLFDEFRSDKVIRTIIHRSRSVLAADDSYFEPDSNNQRQQQGPDIYERVARSFVEQVLERQAGEVLTLNEAYGHFCEFLRRKKLPAVNRKEFKAVVPPAIHQQFELGVRNDLHDQAKDEWHSGWKGIRALDLEDAAVNA